MCPIVSAKYENTNIINTILSSRKNSRTEIFLNNNCNSDITSNEKIIQINSNIGDNIPDE